MIKELLINLVEKDISLINSIPIFLRIDIIIRLLNKNSIIIIKGKYKGLIGYIINSTPKNFYINLLGGKKVRIKKNNIKHDH